MFPTVISLSDAPILPESTGPPDGVDFSIRPEPRRARGTGTAGGLILREPPRLGTGHLLVWLTLIAIPLGIVRPQVFGFGALLVLLVQYPLAGAACGGVLLYVWHWLWRRECWTMQPGEWLWMAAGTRCMLELVGRPLHSVFDSPHAIAAAAMCTFLVIPLFSRLRGIWSFVFVALVIVHSTPLLLACLRWEDPSGWLQEARRMSVWTRVAVSAGLPLAVAVVEQFRGSRRSRLRGSWLHWVGVGVWTAWVLLGRFT